jgi:hypothetical protein
MMTSGGGGGLGFRRGGDGFTSFGGGSGTGAGSATSADVKTVTSFL